MPLSSTLVGGHKNILLYARYIMRRVWHCWRRCPTALRRQSEHVSCAVTSAASSYLYTLVPTRKPIYYTLKVATVYGWFIPDVSYHYTPCCINRHGVVPLCYASSCCAFASESQQRSQDFISGGPSGLGLRNFRSYFYNYGQKCIFHILLVHPESEQSITNLQSKPTDKFSISF